MAGGKFSEANLFGMTIRESANDGSDFTNPDADYRRLFLGEDGVLHLKDSAGTVTTPSSGLSDPMTTRGDIIVRNSSNTTARLAVGSAGKFLTSDGTDTAYGQGPLTTTGDLMIGATGGTPTRLAAGATSGHVLTSNGTGAAPSWQAAAGGGGLTWLIDSTALNGTYGDEFTDASLNARWTRHVQGSGEEAYQQGAGASALRVTYSTGAAARYIYQTAPAGTNETWECSFTIWDRTSTGQMYGIIMVDTSGNGVGAFLYPNPVGYYLFNIASHAYTSTLTSQAIAQLFMNAGQRIWIKLRKASGVFYCSYSLNGETYAPEISGTPSAFTPARIGFGRVLGTDASDIIDIYRFNKTA